MSHPGDFLSDSQRHTLEAVCDTLGPEPDGSAATAATMAAHLAEVGSPADHRRFRMALALVESRALNLFLTGRFRRFTHLDRTRRERVVRAWANSRSGHLRAGFQTFRRLALFLHYARRDDRTGGNPRWSEVGYPGPVTPPRQAPRTIVPLTVTQDTTLQADVVVIGSGAGGGVVAGELAAAGHAVVVLEKGGYYHEADFDGAEFSSLRRLYEKGGILATHDVGVVLLAGSNLGGGTTVNWTTSLRTPDHVLREWQTQCGVAGAAGAEWQASLDAVCARCHVDADESAPNRQDQRLIAGCEALGYHWRAVPRNVKGCGDCGYCSFGCRFGAKQGVLKTYLQDAFDQGTRIVVGCHVDRITTQAGAVAGVEARVNGHRLTVRCKAVVAAAGSIHTPALLKRSGLRNANLGRHLHLHPVAVVFGVYDEPIESWRGALQAAVCDQFRDLDDGYGFILEVAPAHPGLLALGFPWRDGRSHQERMSRAAYTATFIAIARDRDGGRVRVDRRGQPVIDYTVSARDAPRVLQGAQEAARVHAAAGARTIGGPYHNLPELSLQKAAGIEDYVAQFPRRGVIKNDLVLYSAHQMSSCRMGGSPKQAPVSPDGEAYEVQNLFVADASALPTATGVNPMISIMALAHRNAQIIKTRL